MGWIPLLVTVVLIAVLFSLLKTQGTRRKEIAVCVNETGDAERLAELLRGKGLRLLGNDADLDDAIVRLARMRNDAAEMEKALKKMNSRPTPLQKDYLWGLDRFFYALMRGDHVDMKAAYDYVLQVMELPQKKKMEKKLDGMAALTALPDAARTEAKLTPLLTRILGAMDCPEGFTPVESGWIMTDLDQFGVKVRKVSE